MKNKPKEPNIRLHTHLKRMTAKSWVMGYTLKQAYSAIDEILYKYGVRDKALKKKEEK